VPVYFTSDQHFGHANIIKHCKRPFSDVDEMDAFMIEKWNGRVNQGDTVYVVGDLIFRSGKDPREYLDALNGRKHLIVGNHDSYWMKKVELGDYFESVSQTMAITEGKRKIVLSHYPMTGYEGMNEGVYQVYGHIHNNTNDTYWPLLREMPRSFNAGVEINYYTPSTIEEMIDNNAVFKMAVGAIDSPSAVQAPEPQGRTATGQGPRVSILAISATKLR
jgi:calcineurin-like phosphoesterase family protein